jgi:hypothetical protein
MSKVVAIMSLSLDGYVAGPNDGVAVRPQQVCRRTGQRAEDA